MKSANTVAARGLLVEHTTARGVICALSCQEFTVGAGESVAIMGPSGCGKSTLLGLIAGLAQPTKGSVTIGATSITSLTESERVAFRKENFGIVYQADNLLPFLTVAENIRLQLSLCADTKGADAKIADLLEKLGLEGLGERLPDQLSGGQRQRAAIARAIVHAPPIILADEPTGALDEGNATNVVELLLGIQKRLGSTLVIVTHDPKIASKMERIVTL
jgi:putative ABC transport system ATP-binding protein